MRGACVRILRPCKGFIFTVWSCKLQVCVSGVPGADNRRGSLHLCGDLWLTDRPGGRLHRPVIYCQATLLFALPSLWEWTKMKSTHNLLCHTGVYPNNINKSGPSEMAHFDREYSYFLIDIFLGLHISLGTFSSLQDWTALFQWLEQQWDVSTHIHQHFINSIEILCYRDVTPSNPSSLYTSHCNVN